MKRTRLEGTRSQLAGMAFSLALAWSSPVAAIVPNDALSHEEILDGSGDSGGPLLLDEAFPAQLVLGVLSEQVGYDAASPFSSYGGVDRYEPLYLYWDWLAEQSRYAATIVLCQAVTMLTTTLTAGIWRPVWSFNRQLACCGAPGWRMCS